jgi:PKD repeat protein
MQLRRLVPYGFLLFNLIGGAALQATTIVMPTDEQLVEKTSFIAVATVLHSVPIDRSGAIWTETTLQVERELKGLLPGVITVREPGGFLGERFTMVYGTPAYTAGERVLVFLSGTPEGYYRTRDMFAGKFSERFGRDGSRYWSRNVDEEVNILGRDLRPMHLPRIERRGDEFEAFIRARAAGRSVRIDYEVENTLSAEEPDETSEREISSNFTLISEPTIYRWTMFDNGTRADWYSVGSQPGYSGGGVQELETAMAAWTGYSAARILYRYAGVSSAPPGGMKNRNSINEVIFNDPLNDIEGSYNSRTGGVVGVGGFNGVMNGGAWTSPFAADAAHPQRTYNSTFAITEGNLVIQDGVSPANGIPSGVLAEILSHEFGHTLGFGHSTDSGALMYHTITGLGPSLRSDDQLAARWLYPNGGSAPAPEPVPAAPSNLSVQALDSTQARLNWTDNATNETAQSVYVAAGSGSFSRLGDVAANVTALTVSSLQAGQTYRFYVTARNATGESSASNTAQVTMPQPATPVSSAFAWSPASPVTGQNVSFVDQSTGSPTSWRWEFSDGVVMTQQHVSRSFATAASFPVRLTVWNATSSHSTLRSITVGAAAEPLPAAPSHLTGHVLDGSRIALQWRDNATNETLQSIYMAIGSGGFARHSDVAANVTSATIGGLTAGSYRFYVTARNASGESSASNQLQLSIAAAVPQVSASFSHSPTTPLPGQVVAFSDLSSGSPTAWSWSFGDGTTSTLQHPQKSFTAAGSYTVTLTVSNAGSSQTTSRLISVQQHPRSLQFVPVTSQTSGVGSTYWRTELTLLNDSAIAANVDITLVPGAGGAALTRNLVVNPRSSTTMANALSELFGLASGAGALRVETWSPSGTPTLRVSSRTFTSSGAGTYGQGVPPLRSEELAATMYLTGIISDGEYRTNIGLVNHTAQPVATTLSLFDGNGALIGQSSLTLPAVNFQQVPLTSLFPQLAGQSRRGLSARVSSSVAGAVFSYASVIDNRTHDPVYIPSIATPPGGDLIVPVVGRAAGGQGTFWRSDLSLFNPTEGRLNLQLFYLPAGTDNRGAAGRWLALEPRQTLLLADVLQWFGLASGSGAVRISGSPLPIVSSRTYTTVSGGGTFGQAIDAISPTRLSLQSTVTGLRNDHAFRSNIGLVNHGDQPMGVELTLVSPHGTQLGRGFVTLAPFAQTQGSVASFFPGVPVSSLGNFNLQATTQGFGKLVAYGSVIDTLSGDPVYIGGQ